MASAAAVKQPDIKRAVPVQPVATPDIEDATVLDAAEVRMPTGRQASKSKPGWAETTGKGDAQLPPASGRPEDMVHSLTDESLEEEVKKRPSLKSWMRRLGTPSAAKALEEQALKEDVENRRARDEIVKVLRKRPSVLVGLALRADSTAREIMETLTDLHDVPDTLRKSGFNPAELAHLLQLWPRALRAVQPDHLAQTVPWRCICTLTWAFMAAAIAGLLVFMQTDYINGWIADGICNIRSFTNDTSCSHQPCSVNVEARKPGSAEQYMKLGFRLPLVKDWDTGAIAIRGDAFRCCNAGGRILNCCGLFDNKEFEFCDNWPHQSDSTGGICPEGNWRCMFKLANSGAGGGVEVTELKDYDPPGMLLYIAGTAACVIICILVYCRPKIKRCMGRCSDCIADRLTRYDTWMTKQDMLMDSGLEEGSRPKPSLAPPTTLLDTTNKAFTKRPTKERTGTLSKPRQSIDAAKQAELPELPSMVVEKPAFSAPVAVNNRLTSPKVKEEEKSDERKPSKDGTPKDGTPPKDTSKRDRFGPLKDDPVHHDLSSFVHSGNMAAPIIEPLRPSIISGRSGRSSIRSKSSGHSQQNSSRRSPADPVEGWAWANKDELVAQGLQQLVAGSNRGHLRTSSQGSKPPTAARLIGLRPGTAPGVAAPPGAVPAISVQRPASVDGHGTAPQSLRVSAASTGTGNSSRSGRSLGRAKAAP